MGGQGHNSPPMKVQGFSVCFDTEYALQYWTGFRQCNPTLTEEQLIRAEPWIGIALATPDVFAKNMGLSIQDAIDFAHNLIKTETSDLGWETDKTGNSSPAIFWNQGQGFTHPTLTSATRTELLIRLKYDRVATPEDYSNRSIPSYGSPALPAETPTQKELALFETLSV